MNPPLVKIFQDKRKELISRKTLSWEETKPLLCFYGTSEVSISKICEKGFSLGFFFSKLKKKNLT